MLLNGAKITLTSEVTMQVQFLASFMENSHEQNTGCQNHLTAVRECTQNLDNVNNEVEASLNTKVIVSLKDLAKR